MSDLVNELISAGALDSRGVFTVDASKAREKLERFRLADPLGYVVELVQAAGLSGTTHVDVEVTASLLRMRFDGRVFSEADLHNLESTMMVVNRADHPARQQLALGVSAAQALKPRLVIVQSGQTKLVIDENGDRFEAVGPLDAPFTTLIEIQESFRLGLFVEFFRGAFGMQKAERMLAQRCRHARFKVCVNGTVVSGQPAPCDGQIDTLDGGMVGACGFRFGSLEPARLLLLRAGVVQEGLAFADESSCSGMRLPRGFVAVVDTQALPRDASFTRFIRNDAFTTLVRNAARSCQQAAEGLTQPGPGGTVTLAVPDEHRDWACNIARDLLVHMGPEGRTSTNKPIAALRRLPLFKDVMGGMLSVDQLIEDMQRHGRAACLRESRPALFLNPPRPVLLVDPDIEAWMEIIGVRLDNVTKAVDEAEARDRSQVQFRARRGSCELPKGSWGAQVRFDISENERGIIGYREDGSDAAKLIVIVDGCELANLSLPFSVPGLSIVVEGPFAPNFSFDDVARNEVLGKALVRAAAALPALLHAARTRKPSERLRDALVAALGLVVDPNVLAAALLKTFGCRKMAIDLPALRTDHFCFEAELLSTVSGDEISIKDLQRDQTPIGVVAANTAEFNASLRPTLRVSDEIRQVLLKVVPERRLISLTDEVAQLRRRQELLRRPVDSPKDQMVTLAGANSTAANLSIAVTRGETVTQTKITGFVGFRPGKPGKLELHVYCENRALCVVNVAVPLSGLVACINNDDLELTSKLNPKDSIQPMADVALRALPRLLPVLENPWPLACELVSQLIPGRQHALALQRFEAEASSDVGPVWKELLLLATVTSDEQVAVALELMLTEPAALSMARITDLIGSRKKVPATHPRVELLDAVLRSQAAADRTPLLHRLLDEFGIDQCAVFSLDGRSISVRDLLSTPVLRYVLAAVPSVGGFEDVVVLPADLLQLLQRLTVAAPIDASEALAAAAAANAFALKQPQRAFIDPSVTTWCRLAFSDENMRGEVALLPGPPALKPKAELVLLHKGKFLARVAIGDHLGISLLAVVDADDITANADFSDVIEDARLTHVIERVRTARDELVAGIINELPQRNDADAVVGLSKTADRSRLLERLRISHTRKKTALPRTGVVGSIGALGLWSTAAGVLVRLRDLGGEEACVRFITMAVKPAEVPPTFEDVIVVERESEAVIFTKLFYAENVETAFTAAAALHQTRRSLSPLAFDIVDDALVQHSATLGTAALRLGLPRAKPEHAKLHLRVGVDGLLVETLLHATLASSLPWSGVLSGGSVVTKDLRSARVDAKLRGSIHREAGTLWRKAIDQYGAEDTDDDDRRLLGCWLRQTALGFSDIKGCSLKWEINLRLALLDLRVFPIDGGFISLNTAIREQPPALRSLLRDHHLLKAPPPPPPPPPAAKPPRDVATAPKPRQRRPSTSSAELLTEQVLSLKVSGRAAELEAEVPPAPPTDAERLSQRLLSFIGVVREGSQLLTKDLLLDRVLMVESRVFAPRSAVRLESSQVLVDLGHPLARAALDNHAALALLASLVVTRINEQLEAVSNNDERHFLRALIAHARTFDAEG